MPAKKIILILIFIVSVTGCTLFTSASSEVERISAQKLNEMLGQPDIIVVDVRSGSDWGKSESKLKGAVRQELSKIETWINAYAKEKTLIFYCA